MMTVSDRNRDSEGTKVTVISKRLNIRSYWNEY